MKQLPLPKKNPIIAELIETTNHKTLAQWAIDCVERFIPYLDEKYPNEERPRKAIKILKIGLMIKFKCGKQESFVGKFWHLQERLNQRTK